MAVPSGPSVVLTRERADNRPLAEALLQRGVPVVEIPCVGTRYVEPGPLPYPVDAVTFSSRRGVRGLLASKAGAAWLARMHEAPMGAVGAATASELEQAGLRPMWIAEPPRGERLAALLIRDLEAGARVAVVRGNLRAGGMDEALRSAGFVVEPVAVYENVSPAVEASRPFPVAAVFVASPSAGRRLLRANPWMAAAPFFAIGPTTERVLVGLGVTDVRRTEGDLEAWTEDLCAAHRGAVERAR